MTGDAARRAAVSAWLLAVLSSLATGGHSLTSDGGSSLRDSPRSKGRTYWSQSSKAVSISRLLSESLFARKNFTSLDLSYDAADPASLQQEHWSWLYNAAAAPPPPDAAAAAAAADRVGGQGHQAVQLSGGVREGGAGHAQHAVRPRPVTELLPGPDAEPRVLALLQALQGHLHLHHLLQHRLQAGAEGLPRLQLPQRHPLPAHRVTCPPDRR